MRLRKRIHVLDGIHEPNMVPLIDVSLVLVVILLVATPMALQSGIAISGAAAAGRSGAKADVARVEITILDDTRVVVNRSEVAREELASVLRPLILESASRDVVVRCGEDVAHGVFVSVIDEAKALGATRIAVVSG